MEHLKGNSMKRDIKSLLADAKKAEAYDSDNSDNDKKDQKKGDNEESSVFNKFDNPFKFW